MGMENPRLKGCRSTGVSGRLDDWVLDESGFRREAPGGASEGTGWDFPAWREFSALAALSAGAGILSFSLVWWVWPLWPAFLLALSAIGLGIGAAFVIRMPGKQLRGGLVALAGIMAGVGTLVVIFDKALDAIPLCFDAMSCA
jgi:hypothetical protein